MTCIVGLVHNGAIYMGGDSAGTNSDLEFSIRLDPKVFLLKNRFIVGFTTSFRMGQLLRFSLRLPNQRQGQGDYEYMCTAFIDAVRKCFYVGGYMGKEKDGGDRENGGRFLVGYRGVLYDVGGDFQVGINQDPYYSVGFGNNAAFGSLFTTAPLGLEPEKRITLALEAATHFSAGVRPPFVILRLPSAKKR